MHSKLEIKPVPASEAVSIKELFDAMKELITELKSVGEQLAVMNERSTNSETEHIDSEMIAEKYPDGRGYICIKQK